MNSGYKPRAPYKEADNAYCRLSDDVCVGHGYCGSLRDDYPLRSDRLIPLEGYITAYQFAVLVLLAEGHNPFTPAKPDPDPVFSSDHAWTMAWIADAFEHHFGRTRVHVRELDIDWDDADRPPS